MFVKKKLNKFFAKIFFIINEEANSLFIVFWSFFCIHCFSIYLNDYLEIGNGEKIRLYEPPSTIDIYISSNIKPN